MDKRQIGFGDWKPSLNTRKYLLDILKTRRLTYGKYSKSLEHLFCELNGVKHAIFCSSGTAALYASLAVLKNKYPVLAEKRPYVVLPATTFISDFNVVIANGFQPLFVDIAPNYNISYTALEHTLNAKGHEIFAVMPSSLMGRPVDGLRIRELIDTYAKGAFFILDSCENMCSKYAGQYPESFADFTGWSTYISHLLIAGACGGFIGTNNPQLAIAARSFINHGRDPGYTSIDDDDNVDEHTLRDITAKRFTFVQHGLNFRMGEMEAATALSMLEDDFPGQLVKRAQNANKLIRALSKFPLILPTERPEEELRHMMLPIRLPNGEKWDLIHHLEKHGVETRDILPMYQPITVPYFGNVTEFQTNFPVSADVLSKGFYIGCHQYLTDEDIDYIVKVFEKFFK